MSLIKITVTLAPFATGGAIGALFAFHELDAKTKFWLRVVVALGSIATVLGIVVMGSEIIDWFFESQQKVSKLLELFQGLPAEAQRALVAAVVSAIVFGTLYVVYRLPQWRPVVVIVIGVLAATGATYAITEYLQAQQARKYVEEGKKQLAAKNYEAAAAALQKAIQLHPTAESYSYRARALRGSSRLKEALGSYAKAIELEPRADLYRERSSLEDPEDAIADLTRAIELNPTEPDYYSDRAGFLENAGHLKEALRDYTKVIKLGSYPCQYLRRGQLYQRMGRFTEAIKDLKNEAGIDSVCKEHAVKGLTEIETFLKQRAPEN